MMRLILSPFKRSACSSLAGAITNAPDEKVNTLYSPGFFFFPKLHQGWGRNRIQSQAHIRTDPSVFVACYPHRASPLEPGFIVWNASGFKKVFYLKQDYYLNMFYCIFIAPLVLLQFSTSKRGLHHWHVDYTNMSDICNLIGLQLKKCF